MGWRPTSLAGDPNLAEYGVFDGAVQPWCDPFGLFAVRRSCAMKSSWRASRKRASDLLAVCAATAQSPASRVDAPETKVG